MKAMIDLEFLKNKKVLITGHTGFKGRWLSLILADCGIKMIGISADDIFKKESRFLFSVIDVREYFCDIKDADSINKIVSIEKPDVVINMAAQSLVNESINHPEESIATNILGFTNIFLASLRLDKKVFFLNVTTDKVYRNLETGQSFVESDFIGGSDPYSCSKSCVELLGYSLYETYVKKMGVSELSVVNLRAGNVIGGCDFAVDRIVPDIYRSVTSEKILSIRMRDAVRPWQHVLDALNAYLIVMKELTNCHDENLYCNYNIGPIQKSQRTVGEVVDLAKSHFPGLKVNFEKGGVAESSYLALDSLHLQKNTDWESVYSEAEALDATFKWYKAYINGQDMITLMRNDINNFFSK